MLADVLPLACSCAIVGLCTAAVDADLLLAGLLLLAWFCASLGLQGVLLGVISERLLLLWKNSDVLCVAWCCVQEQWCP
jgi:hypothetical protein